MKIVYLEIKKVTLGNFFPNEDKLELEISLNDGADKDILKVVDMADAKKAAENVLSGLILMEKQINTDGTSKKIINKKIVDRNIINIVVKDKENSIKEIASLIRQAKAKIDEIKSKNAAEGYLELIRKLKSLKIEF